MKQKKYADQFLANKQMEKKSCFKKKALEMTKLFAAAVLAMVIITQIDISENWTVNPMRSILQ